MEEKIGAEMDGGDNDEESNKEKEHGVISRKETDKEKCTCEGKRQVLNATVEKDTEIGYNSL